MRLLLAVLTTVLFAATPAFAQAPAHISAVSGYATVERAGQPEQSEQAEINVPINAGDRIRTTTGRVTVVLPDGASIEIDPNSDVEFVTATRVRVLTGAIEHFAAPAVDPRSPSAQNLPPDLQSYGPELDQNGSWQYEPQYGNVWYPTTVGADWRPYYDGYWASVPAYGPTWVGYVGWSWPTHHYGRWGYARSRWFWIPGRTWGAAWVSWSTAPNYVGWCPLGWDGRPVVALSVGYRSASSWNAWTMMRRDQFGSRAYSVRRYGIEPHRLSANTPFIEHRSAPSLTRRGGAFETGARSASPVVGTALPRYSPDPRATANDPRRTNDGQRPATGDHPAYRPRYDPQYTPQYQNQNRQDQAPQYATPRYQAPQSQAPQYRAPDGGRSRDWRADHQPTPPAQQAQPAERRRSDRAEQQQPPPPSYRQPVQQSAPPPPPPARSAQPARSGGEGSRQSAQPAERRAQPREGGAQAAGRRRQ